MRSALRGILGSLLALSLFGACGKATSTPALGGESHWMQHCGGPEDDVDADGCGPGLTCSCGICTTTCSDDASCIGGLEDAACAEPASSPDTSSCGSEAPQRLCVPLDGLTYTTSTEIRGMRYDERGCFRAIETAGSRTTPSPTPCTEIVTWASDPAGNCWRFLTGCLPDGFTEIPSTEPPTKACTAVDDLCIDSLSCASDRFATSAGCLSCEEVQSAFETRLRATKTQCDACSVDADCVTVPTESACAHDCGQAVSASALEATSKPWLAFTPRTARSQPGIPSAARNFPSNAPPRTASAARAIAWGPRSEARRRVCENPHYAL